MTEFKTPVYFIHGENYAQIPISQVKEYFDTLTAPDKRFYPIDNAGHIIIADNLDGVLTALNELQRKFTVSCGGGTQQ
jgi:fermentation-respiration switch protein FrsA (DUF1100 family)